MKTIFLFVILITISHAVTEIDKAFLKRADIKTGEFTLYSSEFYMERSIIPQEHFYNDKILGCNGGNVSPSLYWKYAPKDTKYFAIVMQDTSNGWYHWAMYNIPLDINRIDLAMNQKFFNPLPWSVKTLKNDFGNVGYGGPCMIDGKKHLYKITIYALPDKLDNIETPAMLSYMANKNKIAEASATGVYDGAPKKQVKEVKNKETKKPSRNTKKNNEKKGNVKTKKTKKNVLDDLLDGVGNLKRKIVK
ncbi:MAG: YbhB/YbcL family Raf kinase inhibitor-like protein [Rickettsiales bacterium]|jgi:Raf kinase inhibitor-like YbhB/YbcL family protein|nr:YbhB/YbcL family Raf kinase inhibitor-like protein [Rickettsiales bacterium]